MVIEKFSKGDGLPESWYTITFDNGDTLKDYPNFSFVFGSDCEVQILDNIRYIRKKSNEATFYLNHISNVTIDFTLPTILIISDSFSIVGNNTLH